MCVCKREERGEGIGLEREKGREKRGERRE